MQLLGIIHYDCHINHELIAFHFDIIRVYSSIQTRKIIRRLAARIDGETLHKNLSLFCTTKRLILNNALLKLIIDFIMVDILAQTGRFKFQSHVCHTGESLSGHVHNNYS